VVGVVMVFGVLSLLGLVLVAVVGFLVLSLFAAF
jgi:hypothetical protein